MATIYSTPTTVTITAGSTSGINAVSDWAARSAAPGVMFAENFSTYNTAADWYNRWRQGQMTPVFTPKNPGMGATWTNAWEIITTPGHVLSGKALRAWHGKNNYGSAGTIDNQWACIPFSGNPNNVAAGYVTEFYFQMCVWVDSFFNYFWKLGDGSVGGIKVFILDQWDTSATTGEVVITNQYNYGFVTGYHSVGPSFDRAQNTPGYTPNYAWQPAIDNGTPLDATIASYFRRYGPMGYGMYPNGLNQASKLTSQGVPNPDATSGGVAWNIGGITVVEVYVKLNTPGNSIVKAWAAKYGNAPKKIIDATGVNLGSRVGSLGTGWSGVTLSNLIYTATGAQNPNYPTDAYIDYVEFIVSRSPINFPGGFALTGV